MSNPEENSEENSERERRITDEIIVDCYNEEERAMGWYYYLENQLQFPFNAICIQQRVISPLQEGDEVEVIGMPGEEECGREMFVTIRWKRSKGDKSGLGVPLAQLRPVHAGSETEQAVEDWHYWLDQGYLF